MIVVTAEIEELKAQAEGRSSFVENPTYEALAELDLAEYRKLDAETRLALGFYISAKARGCQQAGSTADSGITGDHFRNLSPHK